MKSTTTTTTGEKTANFIVGTFLTLLGAFVGSTILYTFFIIFTN